MKTFWIVHRPRISIRWLLVITGIQACISLYVYHVHRPMWIAIVAGVALGLGPAPEWAKPKPDESEEDE